MDSQHRFTSVTCSNCRRELGAIITKSDPTDENRVTTTLVVMCPYCNDKSFKQTIEGKYLFGERDGLVKDRITSENNDFIIYLRRY